jgi:imidazolonepropionase-like amidohydrolase
MFALQLRLTKLFAESGVKMLAGSDSGSNAKWDIAGFALHQEFDLLEGAGISPLQVLQMTTCNAAEFLGREATLGSVERGKSADLVLLDANPLASIQNLHKVHAVVRGGAFHSNGALAQMKERIERSALG